MALKSEESTVRSFVRFVNRTQRRVDVVWINYDGDHIKYKTMDPISHLDVDTYVTHPWIFRDADTNQALIVDQWRSSSSTTVEPRDVFRPRQHRPDAELRRILVRISIPMYTLKEHCIRAVRKAVRSREDVQRLDIPRGLQLELTTRVNWD